MRLTSILAAMAVLLLAGVVSVRVLETRMGGATVPGLVVVEEDLIPEVYWLPQAPKLDRQSLLADLKRLSIREDVIGRIQREILKGRGHLRLWHRGL